MLSCDEEAQCSLFEDERPVKGRSPLSPLSELRPDPGTLQWNAAVCMSPGDSSQRIIQPITESQNHKE